MNKNLKKWLFSNASLVSGLFLLMLGLVALTIINLQLRQISRSNAQLVPLQALITPSFYPLAPCPSCINPSQPVPTIVPSSYPTSGVNPTAKSVSPTTNPCKTAAASIASNNQTQSKHPKHRGAIRKFMDKLMQFILELLNILLKVIGGTPITPPQTPIPSLAPTVVWPTMVFPSISARPTIDPCAPTLVPTVPVTAVPKPSTILPSTIVPSISPAPSLNPVPSISGTQTSQIDLTNWKLQLPTGQQGKVDEVKQPQLVTFSRDPWYITNPGGGLRFRAAVSGVTTSGSNYPRSELREMNGTANAAWSPATGTHTMTIEQAITAVPKTKKHVVAGQIHDSSDDIIVVRLELPKLFIKIGDTSGPTLDANYTLGKKFTVKFEAKNGQTSIYYNGSTTPAYTMNKSYSSAYFKAGAYTQSNCTTEASTDCNENNYSEVVISRLNVTHQ